MPAEPAVWCRMWQLWLEEFRKALVVSPEDAIPPKSLHTGYQEMHLSRFGLGDSYDSTVPEVSKDLAAKWGKNPRQIPDCKSCSQELQGGKCPLLPLLVNEGKAQMQRPHTGKVQLPKQYHSSQSSITAPKRMAVGYRNLGWKSFQAHASFLHTLNSRRTGLWEGGHELQRTCWALMCGRGGDAHGWCVEVAFTCWASTHGECEIKLTQTAAKGVPGIHLYREAMLSQADASSPFLPS